MSDPLSRLATIALRAPELPSAQALLQAHTKHFPDCAPLTVVDHEDPTTLTVEGPLTSFSIALSAAPFPWSELSGPCETAWHWPQAKKRLEHHTAHLVVTATSSALGPVDLMLGLTRVVASALLTTPALGVYWPSAMQVHNLKDFVREAEQATRTRLPLYLWLRFGLVREDDGSTGLYTTGMTELDLMEVEFPCASIDPQTLVDRAFNIAHYLLERGPVLEDGHTVGISAEDKFLIRHAPSMLDATRLVYSLSAAQAPQIDA